MHKDLRISDRANVDESVRAFALVDAGKVVENTRPAKISDRDLPPRVSVCPVQQLTR